MNKDNAAKTDTHRHSSTPPSHTTDFLCGVIEGFYGRPWRMSQRLELLMWLETWCMNTYMYAPKDDLKLRAAWRVLYNETELAELQTLASECAARNLYFVYTIAPGLDVRYADKEELKALNRKLDQLIDVGVEHVCVLFDDIPDALSDTDTARFGSLARAQAYLANAALDHVRKHVKGLFLFCPTDYCGRMAQPSVTGSSYLHTLGKHLHKDIDIFWTGPEIVSETIPAASIDELSQVLGRRPLIWDNLHANDYDLRRVYLGPFAGRPSTLKAQVRGILSNPNNEFDVNVVPLRTLAMYAQNDQYESRQAYQTALETWLTRFSSHGQAPITIDELRLLGDFLYLFFEHGEKAQQVLVAIKHMLNHSPNQWGDALSTLEHAATTMRTLFHKLTELNNRDLLYSLYGYVWELDHELNYAVDYLHWLQAGSSGGRFGRPEQLPNTFRGGFAAELQRLIRLDEEGYVSA
ncbi:MAG: beta-N-acetylglucosaminidase domain-containing protein [Deinococcota bacterium]